MIKEDTRYERGTVFEGMTSIRCLIAAREAGVNDRPIEKILFSAAARKKDIAYLRAVSDKHGYTLEESREIERYAIGKSHGGIIALCGERSIPDLDKDALSDIHFAVFPDGIEDPYNFGFALRSAYAAGADAVLLRERNWLSAAGVVARSSAGASELLPIYIVRDIALLGSHGHTVAVADKYGKYPLESAPLSLPLILIAGGEKRGVGSDISSVATVTFRIEYGRRFDSSLSAASAISIASFEVLRQNKEIIKENFREDGK